MMIIMEKSLSPRRTSRRKELTHERIVEAAARAIRRRGHHRTGGADSIEGAGLPHGGFYAPFRSRQAEPGEAADRGGARAGAASENVAASVLPEQALQAMMHAYLSK